jgi:hypothetical protein
VDPQYPIRRYIDGLTKSLVPNRAGEHPKDATTNEPSKDYVGDAKCTNPLYARALPAGAGDELCALPRGPRTPDMVVFAVIGGVPSQLLHFDPSDPDASRLSSEDWTKILGKDPGAYDYSGIDPHMVQSVAPRAGLPAPGSADDADPIHGRDWDTKSNVALDLQYACTFALPTPKNCKDPKFANACDCDGFTTSPLCAPNPADGNKRSLQIRAKAYPSVRELMVARALGDQGVVASICPMHATEQSPGDPLFGYRPAVLSLANAMSRAGLALGPRCVSGLPAPDASGRVACRMLVVQPGACGAGLSPAGAGAKAALQAAQQLADGEVACELPQLPVPAGETCARDAKPGFCVVQSTPSAHPAGACETAVVFSETGNPGKGSRTYIECE